MSRVVRNWSKSKIERVCESIWAGGHLAERTPRGCLVRLSYPESGLHTVNYLIPLTALPDRRGLWLGRRLIAVMRQWLLSLDGTQRIDGREATELTRWLVRRVRRPRGSRAHALTPKRAAQRISLPETIHCGGYIAERSRKGWVVRLGSGAGRLRGHYLVPFRALGSGDRAWNDRALAIAMRQSVRGIRAARPIDL